MHIILWTFSFQYVWLIKSNNYRLWKRLLLKWIQNSIHKIYQDYIWMILTLDLLLSNFAKRQVKDVRISCANLLLDISSCKMKQVCNKWKFICNQTEIQFCLTFPFLKITCSISFFSTILWTKHPLISELIERKWKYKE